MKEIFIHEVGLRDGLQMEKETVPLERKFGWLEKLIQAGIDIIQAGSFVHPVKVPQMADTDELCAAFQNWDRGRTILSGLVLNERGLDRGLACGVEMFCMGVSASETHSRRNTGMSVAEAADRIIAMARRARALRKRVQVSVQSAFGCGFEGDVPQRMVIDLVIRFLEAGLKNISLADTAGHANPNQVEKMYEDVIALDPSADWACHFHNTYGLGLANCFAAMRAGVRYFESSIAGLGGCPFTRVAGGNICTEDFVHYLQRIGQRRNIDLGALIAIASDMSRYFSRELPGMVYKTGPIAPGRKPATHI
jgi:hydroxymethylglutaryl-CoA lyase